MTYSCSIRTDWALPAGDTAETYSGAKDKLAQTSHKGWQVKNYAQPIDLIHDNPPGFCVGVFTDNHRKNTNLLSSQFIGVDYDDCDESTILTHPIIQQYALAVGHTPSHGQPWREKARLRVVFALDAPIAKRDEPGDKSVDERYKLAVQALMTQLPSGYDRQCSDGARFYFGCKEWVWTQADNRLPLAKLREWYEQEKKREAAERADAPVVSIHPDAVSAYVEKARRDEIATLAVQSEGNRNNQLFLSACNLYGLVKAGVLMKAAIDSELSNTARTLGLPSSAIAATLRSAWDTAEARDLSNLGQQTPSNVMAYPTPPPPVLLPAPQAPVVPRRPSYVFSDDAYDQLIDELNGEKIPTVEPLINPYNFLHKFGGFGHVMMPGKVAYLASIAGGSKTIGAETGWEALQRRGVHSVIYSPEWIDKNSQAQEMTSRAIQRNGGPDFLAQMLHKLYLVEQAHGIQNGAGRKLQDDDLYQSVVTALELKKLPGKLFYLDTPGLSVEKICDEIRGTCQEARERGYPIKTAWLDFAQLLWLETDTHGGRVWIETAINLLKDVCREENLVGFITSQLRKGDAQNAKEGSSLEADQMQWLSDQQANLVLLFVPLKDKLGTPILDTQGNQQLRARIVKDNLRGPSSEFFIKWHPQRLTWLDSKVSTAVSLDDEYRRLS